MATQVWRVKSHIPAIVVAFLLLCFAPAEMIEDVNINMADENLLGDVIKALESVTVYLEADYSVVNVDGLFGSRLCQGSLIGASKDCMQTEFSCPPDLTDKLNNINYRLDKIGTNSLPYIKQENEDYFNDLEKTITEPYIIEYISETLEKPLKDNGFNSNYNYDFGITCFSRLMGTYRFKGRKYPACNITDECWHYMTSKRTSGYFTPHQVLFFIIAEQSGCLEKLEELAARDGFQSVRNIERRLCGQIYLHATWAEFDGKMPVFMEDLFLEQTVLCGILGFDNFFQVKWIRMVLSWQTPAGCFSEPSSLVEIERVIYDLKQEYMALRKELSEAGEEISEDRRTTLAFQMKKVMNSIITLKDVKTLKGWKIDQENGVYAGRKLLMEKVMSGGCLAHKTGLAIGTLGIYIRRLIRLLFTKSS